ncbi:hypothetical protein [Sphingomonas sp.]|uniref:hypothetical protein n=1 Tax=Sphingomonas sp. TaxID=28214 RepID=UPI00333ECC63
MFARLILALLLAAFALPALANGPCHDAPQPKVMAAMSHGSHHAPRPDDHAALPHVCLGCIPPASLAVAALEVRALRVAVPRRMLAAAFDPAAGVPPALPPPRQEA